MKKTIKVSGMMCAGCSGRLERALKATEGITAAEVSLAENTASVDTTLSDGAICARIAEIGFKAEEIIEK